MGEPMTPADTLRGAAARLRVLSYGGGTQSAALALMSAAGDLPKLDAVVFADTQSVHEGDCIRDARAALAAAAAVIGGEA